MKHDEHAGLQEQGLLRGRRVWPEIASMSGMFVDLRQSSDHACLDPDPAVGYPAGNLNAAQARAADFNGVIYPSVLYPVGTCIAALRPNVVQSVVQGGMYRLTWSGQPQYRAEQIDQCAAR